jgi:hypothetical protein
MAMDFPSYRNPVSTLAIFHLRHCQIGLFRVT